MRTLPVTIDEVRRIARLAGLALTEAEALRMTSDLGRIIDAFSMIKDLDLPDAAPADDARFEALREDEPREGLDQASALGLAGKVDRAFFVVPRVFGE